MADPIISTQIIRYLESIRIAEGMSLPDFVGYFDMSMMSYWRWRRAADQDAVINIKLSTLENGLKELGYDARIIIAKAEKE